MMRRRTMSRLDGNRLEVAKTVDKMFGDDLHAMRVASIANGVVGVLHAATLSIHAIGRAYAHAVGGTKKHGVKQTDRMLSNDGINVWSLFLELGGVRGRRPQGARGRAGLDRVRR
jgi:hypothetical protein